MNKRKPKANKLERAEQKRKLIEYRQAGTGLFIFRNRSSVASLELPKPSAEGKKWVGPNETWKGDSYFFSMVPREAMLIETITEQKKEETKMQDKLILDQPDQVTTNGRVEHSVVGEELPMNEILSQETEIKEKLITEDPLSGVTIIRD